LIKKETKQLFKLLDEIRTTRNKIAHWEAFVSPHEEKISLMSRYERKPEKGCLDLNNEFMNEFDKKRVESIESINKLYLKYYNEGTVDEKWYEEAKKLASRIKKEDIQA